MRDVQVEAAFSRLEGDAALTLAGNPLDRILFIIKISRPATEGAGKEFLVLRHKGFLREVTGGC
jgi:hypothetical protein